MSEHNATPERPDLDQDIPSGAVESPDEDDSLTQERFDDDFDVSTAREQVKEERRYLNADPSGSVEGARDVVDGS